MMMMMTISGDTTALEVDTICSSLSDSDISGNLIYELAWGNMNINIIWLFYFYFNFTIKDNSDIT